VVGKRKKTITVNDIAKKAKISKTTVSYVLSGKARKIGIADKTAKRIKEIAAEMGYIPNSWAGSLRNQKTGIISVLFDSFVMGLAERIFCGIETVLAPKGYTPIALSQRGMQDGKSGAGLSVSAKTNSILQRRDEAVLCQPIAGAKNEYKCFLNSGVPVIFMGSLLEDMTGLEECSYVIWDCKPAAKVVVKHLVDSGYKRIGYFSTSFGIDSDVSRFEAYVETLQESGLEVFDECVYRLDIPDEKRYDDIRGELVSSFILETVAHIKESSNAPDAIFVLNDAQCSGLLEAIHDEGIAVPEKIALASMGNLDVARVMGITTACEPLNEIGEVAAQLAVDLINGKEKSPVQKLITSNEMVVRRSS